MPCSKIKMLKNLIISHGTCGCGQTQQKEILEPKPKATTKPKPSFCPSSSSCNSWERGFDDHTSTTLSFRSTHCSENDPNCSKMINPYPKLGDSLAVVQDSEDPYEDFRQSMLQMILEKEIYTKDDLQELLNCFLQLNSPDHHQIIVRAFMEIWNGVASKRPVP